MDISIFFIDFLEYVSGGFENACADFSRHWEKQWPQNFQGLFLVLPSDSDGDTWKIPWYRENAELTQKMKFYRTSSSLLFTQY